MYSTYVHNIETYKSQTTKNDQHIFIHHVKDLYCTMKLIFLMCTETDELAGLQYLIFKISSREARPFNARMDCPLLFVHLLARLHVWGILGQKEYIEENPWMKYTKGYSATIQPSQKRPARSTCCTREGRVHQSARVLLNRVK